MRSLTIEQILLLLLFLLAALFNLFVQWRRQRAQQRQRSGSRLEAPAGPVDERRPVEPVRRPPIAAPPRTRRDAARPVEGAQRPPVAAPAPPRPAASRRTRPRRIGTPRELRRAVVLMAVLGPCRAEETAPPPGGPRPGATGNPRGNP
jgi:hypothetical protein